MPEDHPALLLEEQSAGLGEEHRSGKQEQERGGALKDGGSAGPGLSISFLLPLLTLLPVPVVCRKHQ